MSDWPLARRADWHAWVNAALTPKDRACWELSLTRNQPFGDDDWMSQAVDMLGLEHTVRAEGLPKGAKYDPPEK